MSQRYMVRMYEAQDQIGDTGPDTIVKPVDRHISIYASSSEEAEAALQKDVSSGKLPSGRIYQICPWFGNAELIRSLAFALDGSYRRVFLDPASGLYGELRRVRLPAPASTEQENAAQSPSNQLALFPPSQ